MAGGKAQPWVELGGALPRRLARSPGRNGSGHLPSRGPRPWHAPRISALVRHCWGGAVPRERRRRRRPCERPRGGGIGAPRRDRYHHGGGHARHATLERRGAHRNARDHSPAQGGDEAVVCAMSPGDVTSDGRPTTAREPLGPSRGPRSVPSEGRVLGLEHLISHATRRFLARAVPDGSGLGHAGRCSSDHRQRGGAVRPGDIGHRRADGWTASGTINCPRGHLWPPRPSRSQSWGAASGGSIVSRLERGDAPRSPGDRLRIGGDVEHAATIGPTGVRCAHMDLARARRACFGQPSHVARPSGTPTDGCSARCRRRAWLEPQARRCA